MTTPNPIAPPPEMVQQWWEEADQHQRSGDNAITYFDYVAAAAAQWGADQELEACCEWLKADGYPGTVIDLRAARRPKPPSLKEQALTALGLIETDNVNTVSTFYKSVDTVRRALEALPDD